MLGLVAAPGDQMRAIGGAVDRNFAFRAAADGADFFAFGGAEPLGRALLANGTAHPGPFELHAGIATAAAAKGFRVREDEPGSKGQAGAGECYRRPPPSIWRRPHFCGADGGI